MKIPASKTSLLAMISVAFLAGLILGSWATSLFDRDKAHRAPKSSTASPQSTTWTCSMHPQIKLPKAGKCPICFMDLIPLKASGDGEEGPRELRMSEAALALADIETVAVQRDDATVRVDMVGKMAIDTTLIHDVSLLSDAEIRSLYVNYDGVSVKKGDHLAELYSPEVYAAGQDYLVALQSSSANDTLINSSLKKLKLLGIPSAYLDSIRKHREVPETYTLLSPIDGFVESTMGYEGMWLKKGTMLARVVNMSSLWAKLDAYESDLAWVRYGQKVTLEAEALPGQVFEGIISYIPPWLDDRTRTVKIRVNVDNVHLRLKPGMFISATAKAKVSSRGSVISTALEGKWISPMHPEVVKNHPGACDVCGMALVPADEMGYASSSTTAPPLLIPASSVLITGERALVYVRIPGDRPTFEGREVKLGPRAGHRYVVLSGLKEGELVVSKGSFNIDSALQIQAKPSMMSMDSGGALSQSPTTAESVIFDHPALRESTLEFLNIYLSIHQKLTRDDFNGLSDLALQLKTELQHFDASELNPKQLEGWNRHVEDLESSMEHLHHYRDIESFREAFKKVSDAAIAMVQRIGHAKDSIQVMSCPMADAQWLQTSKDLLNPYYGQQMLRCGNIKTELPSIPVAE